MGHSRQWWKEAVVYQVYPASFNDSDGDGIGDLPGITLKLDYIRSLGMDAVRVCPMYDSPQIDMGYDISDYEAVYPPYGTMDDMKTPIQETHSGGMKIMLDLVINPTSDHHQGFQQWRSSKDNPKRVVDLRRLSHIETRRGRRVYFRQGGGRSCDEDNGSIQFYKRNRQME